MTAPGQPVPSRSTASDLAQAATADLLDVLPDLAAWRLDRDRWDRIERILGDLDTALTTADPGALLRATTELERASPALIHLIGATKAVPAPEPLRDRASRLAASLRTTHPRPTPGSGFGVPARPTVAGGEGGGPQPR
jgi:CATRA-Associated Small Protein